MTELDRDLAERIKTAALDDGTRELADATRRLAELLADRLAIGSRGRSIVELEYQDGKLVSLWRHEKLGARALDEADERRPTEVQRRKPPPAAR
jgi:hypothetical protein